ncbi:MULTISPECIES: sugar phosphate isomerase/epimerase family protein [unclassified Streptomyces]|uniref:sugar phosphate isomerase/epimerase family protein n=1 Tax=unclassified Streptomyces TaxID=2593676 RepID=UPI0038167AF0
MKLAFSALGVPDLPVPEVLRLASAHGYHGVELRADEPVRPEGPGRPGPGPAERADLAARSSVAGVEVLGLAAATEVAAPGADEAVAETLRALTAQAAALGAPSVRVLPGALTPGAEEAVVRRLAAVAPHAAGLGVRVLLETHGGHGTGAAVARVLDRVGHPGAGAVWDVRRTWLDGEQPHTSCAALVPHLGYVRVGDFASAEDRAPLALGAGVLPLTECVEVLSRRGWEGWLCWTYEGPRPATDTAPAAAGTVPSVPEPLPGLLGAGRDHLARLLNESA